MSKLSLACLLCFVIISLGDAEEKNSDVIVDSKEILELTNVLVKREAANGEKTKKGKKGKKGGNVKKNKQARKKKGANGRNTKGKNAKKGGNVKKNKQARKKKGANVRNTKGKNAKKGKSNRHAKKGKSNRNAKKGKSNRNAKVRNAKKGKNNGNANKSKGKEGKKGKRKGNKQSTKNGKKGGKRNEKKKGQRNGKNKVIKKEHNKGIKNGNKKGVRKSKNKGTTKNKRKGKKRAGKGVRNGKKGTQVEKEKKKKLLRKKKKKLQNPSVKKNENDRQNSSTCLERFIEYSKVNEKKATAIFKQVNRANNFGDILGKKTGKKGSFRGTYNTLLSALGGNETAPECDGKPITDDTSRMAKYKGTLATLKTCETDVEKVCKNNITETENTTLQDCLANAKLFKKQFALCFVMKPTEACTCLESVDTDNVEKLKQCDTSDTSTEVVAKKKMCVKGFLKCKTAQDDSVDAVGTCKKVNRCGGAPNKTEAARLLKILQPLSAALSNPAFANALKALGLNTGAGSDGKLPGSRLSKTRIARQTDGANCTAILDDWKSFNTSGDKAVPSVAGDVDEAETDKTVAALNKINNRDNTTKDLDTCAKVSSRQTVILTIVRIRFFVFWCGWFQVTIVEIKITILVISFGLPSPSTATTAAPVVTSAPGGGRNIIKQILKRAAFSKP